jgi:hypothetical protein
VVPCDRTAVCDKPVTAATSNTSQSEARKPFWTSSLIYSVAQCPRCYCGENRQMLVFHTNFYCLNDCHMPHQSLRIVQYHRNITPKPTIFTETRTQGCFRTCDVSSSNSSPKQTDIFLAPFFYRAQFPSYRNCHYRESNSGQFPAVFSSLYSLSALEKQVCQVWCKSVCLFSSCKRAYKHTNKHIQAEVRKEDELMTPVCVHWVAHH